MAVSLGSAATTKSNRRADFHSFFGAGMDLFSDETSQNPEHFLDLTNVLTTVTGGFDRRWGMRKLPAMSSVALSAHAQCNRLLAYSQKKDTSWSGTEDTALVLGAFANGVSSVYTEVGSAANFELPPFPTLGDVYAVNSRGWLYAMNGVDRATKINYSQKQINTGSSMGIETPIGILSGGLSFLEFTTAPMAGVGSGFTAPTVNIVGAVTRNATADVVLNSDGSLGSFIITDSGLGYVGKPAISISDPSGTLGPYVTIDCTIGAGGVAEIFFRAPMSLTGGRTYAVAFRSSISGHTSDYIYAQNAATSASGVATQIRFTFKVTVPEDFQIDTIVLMATADGGPVTLLYEVAQIPLSNFTYLGNDQYQLQYEDTLPDSYTDTNGSGNTLLTANIWNESDNFGNLVGIAGNTPPLSVLTKPILHKGRLFATDGRVIYFSKSLSEVTSSTGLITSKWEEAWPGSNVLDIATGNESITALLSDGEVLYIGLTNTVYRLYGNGPSDFSIPAVAFKGVGVASQDCWTVLYKDGQPSGYLWRTPDNKILISDFNRYEEIGRPIYPLISDSSVTHITSFAVGPYSFAVMSCLKGSAYTLLVYDSKNSGWYKWTRQLETGSNPTFAPVTSPSVTSVTHTSPTTYLLWSASTSFPFGTFIMDSNGNEQYATNSGTTGSTVPIWNTTLSGTTTDNTVVWQNLGPFIPAKGPRAYAVYAYNATTQLASPLSARFNDGSVPNSKVITVGGIGITDSRITSIIICRTKDSDLTGPLWVLASVPNPGGGSTWSYDDTFSTNLDLRTRYVPFVPPSPGPAVYKPFPFLGYTYSSGESTLLTLLGTRAQANGPYDNYLREFRINATLSDDDVGFTAGANIPWSIRTSWVSMDEEETFKCLNELETWTLEASCRISVYKANTSGDFGTSAFVDRTIVVGPLGTQKLFLAGLPTKARYYSFRFYCDTPGTNSQVLRRFYTEYFPQAKI